MNGLIALGHNNLIRVGGKCSEELKHYSVQNKAQRILESTELKGGDVQNCGELNLLQKKIKRIRRAKYKAHPGQSTYRKRIDNLFEQVRMTEETLQKGEFIRFETLRNSMSYEHQGYFKMYSKSCFESKLDVLDIFLQLIAIKPKELYDNRKSENNQKKDAAEADLDNDQNIDVIGEGQALTEKWVADQNLFQPLIIEEMEKDNDMEQQQVYEDGTGFQFQGPTKKKANERFLSSLSRVSSHVKGRHTVCYQPMGIMFRR